MHVLALALGKTLAELQELTDAELESWREFYNLYPFDDYHRIYRPAALAAAAYGGELKAKLDWLAPQAQDGNAADLSVMKALGG